jgi:hypothetical protein
MKSYELIFWKLHGIFPILPVVDLNLPYEVESLHHAHCLIGNGEPLGVMLGAVLAYLSPYACFCS